MSFIRKQWPFWLGGLFVGIAEILFYARFDFFIPVTTGLAQMFALGESRVFGLDLVGRVYAPGVHWVIVGAVFGAWLVGLAEREWRAWVWYNPRMMVLAFIGGALFSFGTRIAGGCTTHHFLGGIPAMNIASWGVLVSGVPFAFVALRIATGLGLGGYYRHQDTRKYTDESMIGVKKGYRPSRDALRWGLLVFAMVLLGLPLWAGLFDDVDGSLRRIGAENVTWLAAVGVILGVGISKCGFGTECAVMAPESYLTSENAFRAAGVPASSYAMFRSLLPLQGLMVAIVVFNLFILGSWLLDKGPIPNGSGEHGLYLGHLLGGPLLAMGAVFMIGCEVRTYGRLGLGYGTALAALPGFYVGYLPYTLFKDRIDEVVFGQGLLDPITVPELMSATIGGSQVAWAIGYSVLLVVILVASFAAACHHFGFGLGKVLSRNTDELVYEEK